MSAASPLSGLTLRQLPANVQAEQSVLGSIMANPKVLAGLEFLKPEHFVDPVNGRIFAEQSRRVLAGGVADAVALKTWFEQDRDSIEVGGTAYLAQLITAMVAPGTAIPYGHAIRDAWQRRQLIAAGEDVVNLAFDHTAAPGDIVGSALAKIEGAFGAETDRRATSLNEAMDAALEDAEAARELEGPAGLTTGFASVDDQMGGMEDGTLVVLAGRPGMGKSGLGWQWAIAAARQGVGVAVISLEMSAKELGRRALAALSGVPVWAIKRGRLTNEQASALVLARRELDGLPITIEDGSGLTAAQIDLKARAAHRKHGLGLIMVDHLHIVRPEDADVRQGATWAIGRISGAMKRMAKNHHCPVLLLAQLNRGVEGRDDKRPGLADLRQAGDIEQDADVVSFVYRAEYYIRNEPERGEDETADRYDRRLAAFRDRKAAAAGRAELIFAKIRDGAPGTVELTFRGETASFSEGAHERR